MEWKGISLLICCIILLLIASVLELLIDCTGVVKLGIFMTSMGIFGNTRIFEFSADWAIDWLISGFFCLDLALPCPILGFTCGVSLNKGLSIGFSHCILGSKPLLIPWTSGSLILLDLAWDLVCITYFTEFPIL